MSKKRTLGCETKGNYTKSSEPPTALEDLKSFCPETVDSFLDEVETMLHAATSKYYWSLKQNSASVTVGT